MAKIGRNDPCPCGSGKKYKRCHGSPTQQDNFALQINEAVTRAEALCVQRERQQGLGKPINSYERDGVRYLKVGDRWWYSIGWKTFEDFLGDYIKKTIGQDWGNKEIAKPLEQRHPILVWYDYYYRLQKKHIKSEGKVFSLPKTGAASAYLQLAYDLYTIDHNTELQKKLLGRLRDKENFPGARYEVFVTATFIRAGFEIEFEDEDDRSSSHCEFTATFTKTRKRFSVEAKHRAGEGLRLGRQFNNALKKQAKHQRVVIIDVNTPNDATDAEISTVLLKAMMNFPRISGQIV